MLLFWGVAQSQEWEAHWEESSTEAWLGLSFTQTLVSVNGPNDMLLQIEQQSNWKIESQKVQTVQGKMPATVFRLNCIALKSGSLQLPKLELQSAQGVLEVPERSVVIKSPEVHQGSRLELEFSKNEAFEKEALTLRAKWITTLPLDAIKALKWVIPTLEHPKLRVVEIHHMKARDESKSIGLPIGQRRIIGTWKTEFLEAQEANSLTFEILVQPKEAGDLKLNPSFLVCSVEKNLDKYKNKKWRGNRYPSYFNNNFFEGTQMGESMKRVIVLSEEKQLKVKALPPNPGTIKGELVMGQPEIRLSAEPRVLKVGEPLHLKITVRHSRPEIFELPSLSSMEAFERNFKTPKDRSPASYNKKGEKVYVQTLWPKRSDLTMVPPLVLNSFDPESGFYREVSSNSISIEVYGGETSTFDLAEFAGNLVIKSEVEKDPEGIWHHVWDPAIQPEFRSHSKWSIRSIAVILLLLIFSAQFGPGLFQSWSAWRYDSYAQKAKRFNRDLMDWRAQSQDRVRLRNLVLEHLANHLKQPKSRYDEVYLFECLQSHRLESSVYDRLREWFHNQDEEYALTSKNFEEGEIREIVLQVLQRRVV
jgi:hypothetical protein